MGKHVVPRAGYSSSVPLLPSSCSSRFHGAPHPTRELSGPKSGPFFQVTSDRTRGIGLKLHQGRFRLDIRKNFSTESGQALEQAAQGSGESPSLEVFKKRVDVALRDLV